MSKIQRVGELERKYVEEVLSNNFRSSAGYKMTKRLEDAFAEKFNVNYAVAFCNGTATLHAALEVLGVREGDEVIVPPLTMSSTTFCVIQANATPIYADVDPDTFQISAESIEARITPKTKAIIPVSLYGLAPDFDAIKAIAKKHNLAILEDEALNSALSPTLVSAYLKKRLGYDGTEKRASSQLEISFEHDVFEDGG